MRRMAALTHLYNYFHGLSGLHALVNEGSASSPYPSLPLLSPSRSHDRAILSSHPTHISRILVAQDVQCFVTAPSGIARWQSRSHYRARCGRGA
jgi:hypothetical protein